MVYTLLISSSLVTKKSIVSFSSQLGVFLGLVIFAAVLGALFSPSANIDEKEFVKVVIGNNVFAAEVASTPRARAQGLSGRTALPEKNGMLFRFEKASNYGFWMKGMVIPIDIIWISNGKVVDIEENVPVPKLGTPERSLPIYRPDLPAEFVLELGAGSVLSRGIRIGNSVQISFEPHESSAAGVLSKSLGVAGTSLKFSNQPVSAGEEYFITTLRSASPAGKSFRAVRLLSRNGAYRKYLVNYQSGNFSISGVMNVPAGLQPKGGFPILILNHGLIRPEIYFSGRGSRREQDFFARRGYITIHPDYRGHASSSPNPRIHHDFYVGYTEDVVALIDALKSANSSLFDASRIGMWGHSMGGGMATRAMVLRRDVRAYVLFAPISANVEDNFYELNSREVSWIRNTYGGPGSDLYSKISPLSYFQNVSAPVQVHHGLDDKDVPITFSMNIVKTLQSFEKKVELFLYPGEGHEFADSWQLAVERSLQFFDKYVKNSK